MEKAHIAVNDGDVGVGGNADGNGGGGVSDGVGGGRDTGCDGGSDLVTVAKMISCGHMFALTC